MADYKLTPEQADALLDMLGRDDAYRALFSRDLGAAFAKLPGSPAPPPVTHGENCLDPLKLASKQQIEGARDALRARLTTLVEQKIFLLDR